MRYLVAVLAFALILVSCGKAPQQSGIDTALMDKTVRPQDDLYLYMNGQWLKTYEIPADKSNYGVFSKLADDAEKNLRTIIDEAAAAKDRPTGSDAQKVGDMYLSFMDSTRADKLGLDPIRADLAAVENASSKADLVKLAAVHTQSGIGTTFFLFVDQDPRIPTKYALQVYQGGLSMPDRDYYLRPDARFAEIRAKLATHIETMFTMAGIPDAAKKASRVVALETGIAKAHWANVENRDRVKTYNKFAVSTMQSVAPGFDWKLFFMNLGLPNADTVLVFQPSYLKAFGSQFASAPLDDWKAYYAWRVLSNWAPLLSSNFANEEFNFSGKTIQGIQEDRPRWKRAVSSVEGTMGEIVGRLYVERYFKPEAKERMVRLVQNLKDSFRERIKGLPWMSEETKQKALAKLEKFGTKIGYPDKWKDYSTLVIKADDLVGNARRSAFVEFRRQVDKLGKPIDRTEWGMTPQTVNAYYNPNMNEVVFPAAILQPPFFTLDADDAVNYGGIGAVIGHEMTHGFDDQGRRSDGDGSLTDWWTAKDNEEFMKRAAVMVKQYGAYTPIDTLKLNGQLTLGENIADLGGLTIAYYAYKKSLNGQEAPVIDGFTGDQRFFLGWSQVWARKYRDDELRRRIFVDPHSPSQYRVNGIVSNMPEFYKAYDVKPTDPLYRSDDIRVQIW
jgi:putative endopeptidase